MKLKTKVLAWLIIAFLIITVAVLGHNNIVSVFDKTIAHIASLTHSGILDSMMVFITNLGGVYGSIAIFSIFGAVFILKRKKYSLDILASTFASGIIISTILKELIGRIRPAGYLIDETGFSFPSNHSVAAAVFSLSSILLVAPLIKNNFLKSLFLCISCILFPLIALSRIYLSVHFATDVLAGILLGSICYIISDIAVSKFSLQKLEKYDINTKL